MRKLELTDAERKARRREQNRLARKKHHAKQGVTSYGFHTTDTEYHEKARERALKWYNENVRYNPEVIKQRAENNQRRRENHERYLKDREERLRLWEEKKERHSRALSRRKNTGPIKPRRRVIRPR